MKKTFVLKGTISAIQPLATCSKELLDREGGSKSPVPVPSCKTEMGKRLMFPATGLRGTFRRACNTAIRKRITKITGNPTPFSLDEAYLGRLGGIKGKGEEERSSIAHVEEWRKKNPQLSLFGAGDAGFLSFVDGNLSVSNAICVDSSQPQIFSGVRTNDFYREKNQVAYLTTDDVLALVEREKGGKESSKLKKQIETAEKAHKKAIQEGNKEEVQKFEARIANLKLKKDEVELSSGTTSNPIGLLLDGYQAIPQGERLSSKLILTQSNEIELGLLLAGLDEFSRLPMIGAHYATGCGEIAVKWTVYEITDDGKDEIGTVSIGDFLPIELEGEKLTDALKAFETFMLSKEWDFSIPSFKSGE